MGSHKSTKRKKRQRAHQAAMEAGGAVGPIRPNGLDRRVRMESPDGHILIVFANSLEEAEEKWKDRYPHIPIDGTFKYEVLT